MTTEPRRTYNSQRRAQAAQQSHARILATAKALFAQRGIDAVTIAEIARVAGVSGSSIYAVFKSKEGVLSALFEAAMFGAGYQAAVARLDAETDAVAQVLATAAVARAIYEGEASELGLMRGVSAVSPALKSLEQGFEDMRYRMQGDRMVRLFAEGRARAGLTLDEARRLLWMYTSRDIYRMLVQEGGWGADQYEAWLKHTIAETLLAPA